LFATRGNRSLNAINHDEIIRGKSLFSDNQVTVSQHRIRFGKIDWNVNGKGGQGLHVHFVPVDLIRANGRQNNVINQIHYLENLNSQDSHGARLP
jgi:hypothetical protein